MKLMICALIGLTGLCCLSVTATELKQPDTIVRLEHAPNGFWTKKMTWKPRWVKTWKPKTIYVAHWHKTWGPVQVKEWVPIPKPPPGWVKPIHKPHIDHIHHHHDVHLPLKTYAPAHGHHVDLLPHHAPLVHAHEHKAVDIVHSEGLHFHAAPDAHYGPAFHHAPHHNIIAHHPHPEPHHHHHHPEIVAHHPEPHHHHHVEHVLDHHHHEHLDHPLAHEHIVSPSAEGFQPSFLPLSTEHLKIK